MTSSMPLQNSQNVQHNFVGDANVLKASYEKREQIRKVLAALAQDLQTSGGPPTQIKAEIKVM